MASIERNPAGGYRLTADLPVETESAIVLPFGADGGLLPVQQAVRPTAPPTPHPAPVTPVDLTGVTMLLIAGQPFAVDGVNRVRQASELILYTLGGANRWGTDLVVDRTDDGSLRIVEILARERDRLSDEPPLPPATGFVVSAHGATGWRLLGVARPGSVVELRRDGIVTPPVGVARSGPLLATYMKCWPSDVVRAADLPAAANGLHLGFLRNAPGSRPRLVGYTSSGLDVLRTDLADLRRQQVEISVSIGGSRGAASFADPTSFMAGVAGEHATLGGFDLLDLDMESGPLDTAEVLAFDDLLAIQLPAVRWTAAPNGSWIDEQLDLLVELYRRGRLRAMGQQFYEGRVLITENDVARRLEQATARGIGADALGIGIMIGAHPKYWSVDEAAGIFGRMHGRFGIRHAYAWDITHGGTAQALSAIRALLPTQA